VRIGEARRCISPATLSFHCQYFDLYIPQVFSAKASNGLFIGFFPLNKKTPRLNGLALLEPTRAE
jgi:hypothetical protein